MRRTVIPLMLFSTLLLTLFSTIPVMAQPGTGAAYSRPVAHSPLAQEQAEPIPPGGFVRVSGSQLVRHGQPVQLLGFYYEPQNYTYMDMWQYWDSTRIAHDLQLARQFLGANVVLVRLPYGVEAVSLPGELPDEMMLRIREFVQIAGDLDMRVIFTLFSSYESFPMPGRNSEHMNIRYLEYLIGSFAGDERILGWNIYHQPDRHWLWSADKERVVSWLVRMANHARLFSPNQLVMVSLSSYDNAWESDFDEHVLYDFIDVIMLRGNDPEEIVEDVTQIRERTSKPILLHDFAWASGPPCRTRKYTEEQQAIAHRNLLQVMGEGHLSGLFLRRLHDIDGGPLNSWDDRAFYTGLLRLDYSPKPAAQELLAYGAPPLPNVTTTSLPLRVVAYKPPYVFDPDSEDDGAPKPIEGTPFYVKRDIRRVWDTFGGQYSFGLPLMNAYKRAEDNRVVQYFEAGVIVLYPDARDDEDYQELGHLEKLMARARLMNIGSQYTEGRVFAPPEREYRGERYFPETGHYLRGEFRRVYQNSLGEWRLGLPLSEQILEEVNGEQLVVQYFENGRLELDPVQNRGRFGQLGSWRFAVQCENMP